MALLVPLYINETPIGLLNIHNLGTTDDKGFYEYEVTYGDQYARFTHWRPGGALECLRRAIVALDGCIDNHHPTCIKSNGVLVCTCTCHATEEAPENGTNA